MNEQVIKAIADSFVSFEKMYDILVKTPLLESKLHPVEVGWAMQYFADQDDFDKAYFLQQVLLNQTNCYPDSVVSPDTTESLTRPS